MKLNRGFLLLMLVCILPGCNSGSASTAEIKSEPNPTRPTASLQGVMLALVDPNADALWNAISTTVTAEGVTEVRPQTDEDWLTLRHHAMMLREVYNLLIRPGRKVAHIGLSTSSHESELQADRIEDLIRLHWTDYMTRAVALQDAAQLALNAIENRDVDGLEEAGGIIEAACEACHSQFWYPGDAPPSAIFQ